MRVRFLLDENMSHRVRDAVLRRAPGIDIVRVGNDGAPALETSDPEILLYAEEQRRLLITLKRASMPRHVADHFRAGRHHWGVLRVKRNVSIAILAEQIMLIWEASEAEDWLDQFDWIPL